MSSSTTAPLPSYPGTILPMLNHPARKHLTGTTLVKANLKEPVQGQENTPTPRDTVILKPVPKKSTVKDVATKDEIVYLATGTTTINRFSDVTMSTKRASYASTTKSELRQANHQLFEMLQSVQSELATQRAMMLDIQSRLSFLEQDAPTMVESCEPGVLSPTEEQIAAPSRPPPPPPRRPSSLIAPGLERQSWWQACQNFAENCDTPFNAQEFLKTGGSFDDFDFHFGGLTSGGTVQPESYLVLDIDEVPALSPSSEHPPTEVVDIELEEPSLKLGRQSIESVESMSPSVFSEAAPRTSGLTMDHCEEIDNIIEQIVEFKKPAALPPLLLHPPPSGKPGSIMSVEEITALPELQPIEPVISESQRHRKGMRSITNKWASLKGRTSETSYYRNGIFSTR